MPTNEINPFETMMNEYPFEAGTLVAMFCAARNDDELFACLRFHRMMTGESLGSYLEGRIFEGLNVYADGAHFELLQSYAQDVDDALRARQAVA
jgi:hypothetical protein